MTSQVTRLVTHHIEACLWVHHPTVLQLRIGLQYQRENVPHLYEVCIYIRLHSISFSGMAIDEKPGRTWDSVPCGAELLYKPVQELLTLEE